MTPPVPVTAVVPLNALRRAKGRLADGLPQATRRELATWMCGRVLDACLAADEVGEVILVAGDEDAAAAAGGRDVEVVVETRAGLALAVATAQERCAAGAPVLIVAADLPLVSAADITAVCRLGAEAPAVVVAPTADGGTGALLRNPWEVMPTAFGRASAQAHRRLAALAGAPAEVVIRAGLHLDVDTPAALREAASIDARVLPWAQLLGSD